MKQTELRKMLDDHKEWLENETGGKRLDLGYFDLRDADLRDEDLSEADLRGADLSEADLSSADLRYADLRGADLRDADLSEACLRGACLFSANLEYANLKDIKVDENTLYYHLRCPEEGSYIGFKKCAGKLIVKLEIPADAYRSSATTNKCRASKAKVLEISDVERKHFFEEARSVHDSNFVYKVGEVIEVPDFNNNRWEECATGIHHFMTRKEAIVY